MRRKSMHLHDSLKRLFVSTLSIMILLSSTSPVYAAPRNIVLNEKKSTMTDEQKELQKEVIEVTHLLESVMKCSYNNAVEEVQQEIVSQNYSYELTMESLNEQGNPFANYDYTKLIAIYATIKEHSDAVGISNVNFVKPVIEETQVKEYKPVRISRYEKKENGYYEENGYKYINFPLTTETYEATADGYKISGKQEIIPGTVNRKYGLVSFQVLDPEELFKIFDVKKTDDIESEYKYRISVINQEISGTGLSQSIFLNLHINDNTNKKEIEEIYNEYKDETTNRKALIDTALSLLGKVPYEWGGKSEKAGYDSSWWTFGNDGKQKGLDCSGFVQWVYRTSGFPQDMWNKMLSTGTIMNSFENESKEELEVGDLGLLNNGDRINHVGIYAGDGYWIHCSSSKSTVIIQKDFPFTVFKKVPQIDSLSIDTIIDKVYYTNIINSADEDIYLLSQLVTNEALGEGLNGWVAATEVVMNRIASDKFPNANTIQEVVYADEQFENVEKIKEITPPEDLISVVRETLAGNMSVLNNPYVLFFKNAHGSTEDWGTYPYYTTIGKQTFYTIGGI